MSPKNRSTRFSVVVVRVHDRPWSVRTNCPESKMCVVRRACIMSVKYTLTYWLIISCVKCLGFPRLTSTMCTSNAKKGLASVVTLLLSCSQPRDF